ncbi:50S ribosomal protein L7/L12 [Mycoplasma sp. (ex Biomphalaria glabrata)]|uniref:50S ribosomal protein L7/L12 n=1 Tax=Mycoplasma sp. (ex Biomphalaria glabrata) TaxID=1749074 RepID=UPI00073AA734|nr:50S ribosomal protein L7/L12 [Mycoplasma sp. (ex Biomphalaria glabrata)]ALV23376.1 50S ribosomal protein L7/L12 [Mycoplasma sp. (ex Biomphalaria glabrata)]
MQKLQIIEAIEKMSVLELNDLVKAIEEKFGVTAAAPTAVAGNTEAAAEAKAPTEVSVLLKNAGTNKIAVIKEVCTITGLGLMQGKQLVDKLPAALKEKIKPEEAEEIAKRLKDLGAEVEVK